MSKVEKWTFLQTWRATCNEIVTWIYAPTTAAVEQCSKQTYTYFSD